MNQKNIKIVFVSRGHSGVLVTAPFIFSQAEALRKAGVSVEHFLIKGKYNIAYLTNAFKLKKYILKSQPDLIHAHYSLSGFTALIAQTGVPIILSVMGSDVMGEYISEDGISFKSRVVKFITRMILPYFDAVISKSAHIDQCIAAVKKKYILPNGVTIRDISREDRLLLKEKLAMDPSKQYVLFLGNTQHTWKNFSLAKKAVSRLHDSTVELLAPYPIEHEAVYRYIAASDVVISTSFMEGSSNIIKEAMALNKPVVSTDTGDVRWLFGNEKGHFIVSFRVTDVAEKLHEALIYAIDYKQTTGCQRIIELGLDSVSVTEKLLAIYNNVLNHTE